MEIRLMDISDYEGACSLWLSCPGMGLNNVDDSRAGIEKYLKRNPNTCFVAVEGGRDETEEVDEHRVGAPSAVEAGEAVEEEVGAARAAGHGVEDAVQEGLEAVRRPGLHRLAGALGEQRRVRSAAEVHEGAAVARGGFGEGAGDAGICCGGFGIPHEVVAGPDAGERAVEPRQARGVERDVVAGHQRSGGWMWRWRATAERSTPPGAEAPPPSRRGGVRLAADAVRNARDENKAFGRKARKQTPPSRGEFAWARAIRFPRVIPGALPGRRAGRRGSPGGGAGGTRGR